MSLLAASWIVWLDKADDVSGTCDAVAAAVAVVDGAPYASSSAGAIARGRMGSRRALAAGLGEAASSSWRGRRCRAGFELFDPGLRRPACRAFVECAGTDEAVLAWPTIDGSVVRTTGLPEMAT